MARVYLTAGLGFGDEGKGATVDYLTRSTGANLVVRYNGGSQAAHNVVLPDGRHHCFAQFGSGSFVPGVGTHLSRFMIVNPITMIHEGEHLEQLEVPDPWGRVTVDREALITTPFHIAANRIREKLRGQNAHGSCGMGIGETVKDSIDYPEDALRAGDLLTPRLAEKKLARCQERKLAEFREYLRPGVASKGEAEVLTDTTWPIDLMAGHFRNWAEKVRFVSRDFLLYEMHNTDGVTIFEGAQGVLLDEWFGFHPHTTWSTTTFKNAEELLQGFSGETTRVGVMRTYMTRHGAGPFVTEDSTLKFLKEHNQFGEWQRGFRLGHLDIPMIHYALRLLGHLDMVAINHVDHLAESNDVCMSYENRDLEWALAVASEPGSPVSLERQERLGKFLSQAHPSYMTMPKAEVLGYLREVPFKSVPNILYSNGPTFQDKSWQSWSDTERR